MTFSHEELRKMVAYLRESAQSNDALADQLRLIERCPPKPVTSIYDSKALSMKALAAAQRLVADDLDKIHLQAI